MLLDVSEENVCNLPEETADVRPHQHRLSQSQVDSSFALLTHNQIPTLASFIISPRPREEEETRQPTNPTASKQTTEMRNRLTLHDNTTDRRNSTTKRKQQQRNHIWQICMTLFIDHNREASLGTTGEKGCTVSSFRWAYAWPRRLCWLHRAGHCVQGEFPILSEWRIWVAAYSRVAAFSIPRFFGETVRGELGSEFR